jgi:hypothetical protein
MIHKFTVKCAGCGDNVEFVAGDVPDLRAHIRDERSDGYNEGKVDGYEDGAREALKLFGLQRPMLELSAAIRRGDRAEAEIWIDRIADEMGAEAYEDVQQGRFGFLGKAAA